MPQVINHLRARLRKRDSPYPIYRQCG